MNDQYTITTLGSHSALQILKGAHDEGFKTLAIALNKQVSFYKRYSFITSVFISGPASYPCSRQQPGKKNGNYKTDFKIDISKKYLEGEYDKNFGSHCHAPG